VIGEQRIVEKNVSLHVYLDRGLLKQLDDLAAESSMTRSEFFTRVVLRGIPRVEAAHRQRVAKEQQMEFGDTGLSPYFEEVRRGRKLEAERQERLRKQKSDPDYSGAMRELREIEEKLRNYIWRKLLHGESDEHWSVEVSAER
jgi:hypothetical protein